MRFSDISRSFRYSHFFSSKKRLYNSFAVTHTHTQSERERERVAESSTEMAGRLKRERLRKVGGNVTVGESLMESERYVFTLCLFLHPFHLCVSSLCVRVASLVRSFLFDKTGQVFWNVVQREAGER